jgi:hypothetical protein
MIDKIVVSIFEFIGNFIPALAIFIMVGMLVLAALHICLIILEDYDE